MRIGILGGGQLGRMLAQAGAKLGHEFLVLSPEVNGPAAQVAPSIAARFDDPAALAQLARSCDVVTYEIETVPASVVDALSASVPVRPGARALRVASDRLEEKRIFTRLGIPTVPFHPVSASEEMDEAIAAIGLPAVLKTRREGYDGRGQRVLRHPSDVEGAYLGLGGGELLLEGFVDFRRELSVVAVRGLDGELAFYPLVENRHEGGILRMTRAPAPNVDRERSDRAQAYARSLLEDLQYVGVLALELFDDGERLLANEIAPRVHNSGHWTIEGARTSQFENHLRAITGAPLGSTEAVGQSAMINVLGALPDAAKIEGIEGAHLHMYGKAPRPGRKLGHVTIVAPDADTLAARLERV